MNRYPPPRPRQQGYTLLEILVALFIGLFLLTGLFTILQNTRRSTANQSGLAQLQDEERMAMSLLNDVIQNAGYFDPTVTSASIALPAEAAGFYAASSSAMISGQALTGIDGAGATGDTIITRAYTAGGDGMINCNGGTSVTAGTFISTFFIQSTVTGTQTTYTLSCTNYGGTTVPLVTGVQAMQIYYGVSTVAGTNNVDTYLTATQVQALAGGWASVSSVRVSLTFVNPYDTPNTTGTPVYFTRVIPLQGRTGVTSVRL